MQISFTSKICACQWTGFKCQQTSLMSVLHKEGQLLPPTRLNVRKHKQSSYIATKSRMSWYIAPDESYVISLQRVENFPLNIQPRFDEVSMRRVIYYTAIHSLTNHPTKQAYCPPTRVNVKKHKYSCCIVTKPGIAYWYIVPVESYVISLQRVE